ncbi:hypothetical protein CHS0354_006221 [Potamilus streckersoni]|uniref:Neurotransmitter-gated ion-channel ligand-binding domain-containing protein n=1 Tax=Potamilus streckersoni TaxID=2493646 RepID=A0AAE0VQ13_9BIVA|nr:hypothetical protein CHS0354_006221 [Potamilus streckersoni]
MLSNVIDMDMFISFIIVYLLLSNADEGHAASWSDASAEVEKITMIYKERTDMIPLQNTSKTLYVLLDIELLAINDFDDVAGIIDINTFVTMQWTEEIYFNAYGSNATDTSVTISAASIWKPPLILVNSAGDGTEIVQDQSQVRIHLKSGKCELTENVIFKASCQPNVYFYPLDVHVCSLKLNTRAYSSSELTLNVSSFRKDNFEKNVLWVLRKTYSETLYHDSKSYAKFQITIRRRATNYVINYILPVAILSGLNPFVFILTRYSGERAGYSVTCFLAVVVFMNTTVAPRQGRSILMYYLTGVMITSAVIILAVCFTLVINRKIEEKERKSGPCCCNCFPNQVEDISIPNQQEQNNYPPRGIQALAYRLFYILLMCMPMKCCRHPIELSELRWIHVANIVDISFFIFFFSFEFLQFIFYIIILAQQNSAETEMLDLGHLNA